MNIPFVSSAVSGILSSISIPSIPISSNMLLTKSTACVVVFSVNFFHFITIPYPFTIFTKRHIITTRTTGLTIFRPLLTTSPEPI